MDRCRVVKDQEVTIPDLVRGEVTFNTNTLGDFVILRSNGLPVYVSPPLSAPHSPACVRGGRKPEFRPLLRYPGEGLRSCVILCSNGLVQTAFACLWSQTVT